MERGWADQVERRHRAQRKRSETAKDVEARAQAKLSRPEASTPMAAVRKTPRGCWDSLGLGRFELGTPRSKGDTTSQQGLDSLGTILELGGRPGFRALREFILAARGEQNTAKIRTGLRRLAAKASSVDDILLVGGLRVTFLFRRDLGGAWRDLQEATRKKLVSEGKDVGRVLVGLV